MGGRSLDLGNMKTKISEMGINKLPARRISHFVKSIRYHPAASSRTYPVIRNGDKDYGACYAVNKK